MIGTFRDWKSAAWIRIETDGPIIASVERVNGPEVIDLQDEWIGPAFWDIQVNGRWGISFSDPDLNVDQVSRIVRAQAALGTSRFCPTLISAPANQTSQAIRTIARACELDRDIERRVLGIHLEGPYLSDLEGFRGAHPVNSLRDPDRDEFRRWQDDSGGRIVLVTLAPERAGAIAFIDSLVKAGVTVAIGHSAADGATIREAVDAGATSSTHLGNGIASPLARHPNPIFEQAAEDRLFASIIADGHHLDPATLRVIARSKTADRLILVSDASPLAGSPAGDYGAWSVLDSGKIIVRGTDYLAGSALGLADGLANLRKATGLSPFEALSTVTRHPARLLGLREPRIEPGEPADLVVFTATAGFELRAVRINGESIALT